MSKSILHKKIFAKSSIGGITGVGVSDDVAIFVSPTEIGSPLFTFKVNATGLGVGRSPILLTRLTVQGEGATSATFSQKNFNSSGTVVTFAVRDDGLIQAGTFNVSENLSIGFGCGLVGDNVNCSGNTFLGTSVAANINQGFRNVGIGAGVFSGLTNGDHNIGIGSRNIATTLTTGNQNIFIGGAISCGTDPESCIIIGYAAGGSIAGADTVGIGRGVFGLATTVSESVAVGSLAFSSVVTGDFNTGLGNQAGQNSTGSRNIYLGYQAGRQQTSGDSKLLISSVSHGNAAAELADSIIYGIMDATNTNQQLFLNVGRLSLRYIPTSAAGLTAGDVWNDAGTLKVA